jgi:hypothetical protein
MVTKKKLVKKQVKKQEPIDKEEIKEVKVIKPLYKPVFLPITIEKVKTTDANYFGIRQWLKNNINLDTFRKIKEGLKEDNKLSSNEIEKLVREELGE